MSTDDPIIRVRDVTVHYPEGTLLENLTFDVLRGEIFVILGASGCGKSTLLKHMIGLLDAASGEIFIDGTDILTADEATRMRLMRRFGVLYQSGALFGSMSIAENIALVFEELAGIPRDLAFVLARRKLAAVGLSGFEHYLPDKLSGGMRKRAALARALALDPPLLFLDEPSAGLDPISSAELDKLILRMREMYGTTMVIVTHELDSIYTIADTLIILNDKRMVAWGPVQDIVNTHEDSWVRRFFTRLGTKTPPPESAAEGAAEDS